MTVEESLPLRKFRALIEQKLAAGMSHGDVARALDMPVTRLMRLCSGDSLVDLTADAIQRAWNGLGVPPAYFFVEPTRSA